MKQDNWSVTKQDKQKKTEYLSLMIKDTNYYFAHTPSVLSCPHMGADPKRILKLYYSQCTQKHSWPMTPEKKIKKKTTGILNLTK